MKDLSKSLIGQQLNIAKDIVVKAGKKPAAFNEKSVICNSTIPNDVVVLLYDKKNIVTSIKI